MSGEEKNRRLEQPFDPASWAVQFDGDFLEQLKQGAEVEHGKFPRVTPDLTLTRFSLRLEAGETATQGCTFYVDENNVLRELHQNVFPKGITDPFSFPGSNVLFSSSILYYPETLPFTHSEGPTVSVTSHVELTPSELSFSDMNASSISIGSGLIYQPLRNYPDLGLKPAYGELRTSVGIVTPDRKYFSVNDQQEGPQQIGEMTVSFEPGQGNLRTVLLKHPSSARTAIFELDLSPSRFRPKALLGSHPVFPVRISFDQ